MLNKQLALAACLIALLMVILGASTPVGAQGPTPTPMPLPTAVSPDTVLSEAQHADQSASRAMDTVSFVLNFLQVAGLVATLLIGAGAFVGIRTINEYRAEISGARDNLNTMLASFEKRIDDGLAEIRRQSDSITDFERRIDAGVTDTRSRGDRAIRALTLVQLGEQQMEERNWTATLRTFEEAYVLDPENRATNYFLGELYIMQRNLVKGEERLRQAQASGDIYPPAEAALAYVLRLKGNQQTDINERNRYYAQAERRFLEALKIDPRVRNIQGESVYGMLGSLYRGQGRIQDALRCFEEAERVTPHNTYPVINQALVYLLTGDDDRASRCFQRAIELAARRLEGAPADYWARFNLITAYAALGHTDDALGHLDVLLEPAHSSGSLDSFMRGLRMLRDVPHPPDGIDLMIAQIQAAIERAPR
jgi:tetratricopeptide (TPR) repeat protein